MRTDPKWLLLIAFVIGTMMVVRIDAVEPNDIFECPAGSFTLRTTQRDGFLEASPMGARLGSGLRWNASRTEGSSYQFHLAESRENARFLAGNVSSLALRLRPQAGGEGFNTHWQVQVTSQQRREFRAFLPGEASNRWLRAYFHTEQVMLGGLGDNSTWAVYCTQ